MKKKWQIMVAVVLSLVTLISVAAPTMAQDEGTAAAERLPGGALAIIAPWSAPVGGEFTVRTFLRENQEPFAGAGVWAFSVDKADTVKGELGRLRQESSLADVDKDYESILNAYGAFLGQTGRDGRLACTFEQAGRYILVAAQNGYMPGFTRIDIRGTAKALGIRAPRRAPLGEEITIAVFERVTQDTVADAGVWAVTQDNIEALKQEARELKQDTSLSSEEKDYETLVNNYGFFLGSTDEHGELDYTFNEAGGYLLVAVKRGHIPGFAPLAVYDRPEALGIKATPPRTHVGKVVRLDVFNRQSNDPVGDAGIWAISRDKAGALREEIAERRKYTGTAADEKDYEAAVSLHGEFLGRTDDDGKLSTTFDTAGIYLLVTAKKDYLPGFTVLAVRDMPQPNTIEPEAMQGLN
ncbi:hypothetical protein ACFLX5_03030 [Chloroflexota bacterium]